MEISRLKEVLKDNRSISSCLESSVLNRSTHLDLNRSHIRQPTLSITRLSGGLKGRSILKFNSGGIVDSNHHLPPLLLHPIIHFP